MNQFIYGFCACSLSAMLWPSLVPIGYLPILCFLALLCLKKGPFIAGCLLAIVWLSAFVQCLFLHQNAEKPQQIQFTAQIVALVSQNSDWISFDVRVIPQTQNRTFFEAAALANVQRYYRLTWQKPAKIEPGQIWQFTARMKGISSIQNQGGFNQQKHYISQHIIAKGRVKRAEILNEGTSIRQKIMEVTLPILQRLSHGDILQALIFGDKSALDDARWQQLRQTGSGHLVAISGLHLSVVFGLFYGLLMLGTRALAPKQHRLRVQVIMLVAALITLGYGYLSGFAIATQRALLMMLLLVIFSLVKQFSHSWDRLLYALFFVLLIDPVATLGAGLWLSFLALAIILLAVTPQPISNKPATPLAAHSTNGVWQKCMTTGRAMRLALWQGIKILWSIQWRLAIGLGGLQAVLFGMVTPHSIWLNLLFVPWFSLVAIPLTMLCFCLWLLCFTVFAFLGTDLHVVTSVGATLFTLANFSLIPFDKLLHLSDHLPWALLPISEQALAALLFMLIAILAIHLRLHSVVDKRIIRFCLMILCLPVGFQAIAAWQQRGLLNQEYAGLWQMHVLDVAQGTAIVMQQGRHGFIYDTGAAYGEFSYAKRAIVPFLTARGISQIDYIVVSHDDNDHVGGLSVLLQAFKSSQLIADFSDTPHSQNAMLQPCSGNMRWLNVDIQLMANPLNKANDNNNSCVMSVTDGLTRVLLTGDIEAPRELSLLQSDNNITADILLVPHHGSRTSSTEAFIEAVNPSLAIVNAGFANQYGFPKADVMARYHQRNVLTLQTGYVGQISLTFTERGYKIATYRQDLAPFWYNQLFKFGETTKAE
ncbi:DNA internalization-related competence protein ComEC/Rec2 [Shewanella inventionis]|uniref:DNA internalization-related competence protein ComEC/Rec2 n=1 Tax=Shewanella inventionis TaxID=1738770 RepID=UPI001CBBDC68|nr:DNA internalization-related competence protein ComEC/Rec2 [Shewanella inventionis]UAL41491.1 DNA internalization-related competence protein ComEC/Rec2 [Shewanella inventionis]